MKQPPTTEIKMKYNKKKFHVSLKCRILCLARPGNKSQFNYSKNYWLSHVRISNPIQYRKRNIRYFIQFSNSKIHKRQSNNNNNKKIIIYLQHTSKTVFIIDIYGIVKIQNKSINLSKKFNMKPKFNKFFPCSVIIGKCISMPWEFCILFCVRC